MLGIRVLLLVSAMVLAACGGAGATAGDAGNAASAGGSEVEVAAGDLFYDPQELSAAPGEIAITLDNQGAVEHDVVIEEAGDAMVVKAPAGERVTGTVSLESGTYTFYCAVTGHRAAGMEGTLTVN